MDTQSRGERADTALALVLDDARHLMATLASYRAPHGAATCLLDTLARAARLLAEVRAQAEVLTRGEVRAAKEVAT